LSASKTYDQAAVSGCFHQGQENGESAALAAGTHAFDVPAVFSGDLLNERQPQARALS